MVGFDDNPVGENDGDGDADGDAVLACIDGEAEILGEDDPYGDDPFEICNNDAAFAAFSLN
jgi:hypothetical protein